MDIFIWNNNYVLITTQKHIKTGLELIAWINMKMLIKLGDSLFEIQTETLKYIECEIKRVKTQNYTTINHIDRPYDKEGKITKRK